MVKSVDRDSKTMVVKDASKGVEEGSKVSVNYTEKGGRRQRLG